MGGATNEAKVLCLTLHGRLVGYLAGFGDGRNVMSFAAGFANDPGRPTFSLNTHPDFHRAGQILSVPKRGSMQLHPVLSNLLPEGPLRELAAKGLKVHVNDEFHILAHLGGDLPGALVATPMEPGDVPAGLLAEIDATSPVRFDDREHGAALTSLAGVQMKFSAKGMRGRYSVTRSDARGEWIVKTPSTTHRHVPQNEFTTMSLAAMAGVEMTDFELVAVDKLDGLPPVNLPDESQAFSIKRFDRRGGERIHMEDFAQVFVRAPDRKYDDTVTYSNIGRLVYRYSGDGLADSQQMARRLLVNILLANGDAHLKNWSLVYPDRVTPRLSPAYDIVMTSVYAEGEKEVALKLGRTREWYSVSMDDFEVWAKKADIPWKAIKPHLDDAVDNARTRWPDALEGMPMDGGHKKELVEHWSRLGPDFRF